MQIEPEEEDRLRLFMRDGSRVEGYLEFFPGVEFDSGTAGSSKNPFFLKLKEAKIFLSPGQIIDLPWILINSLFVTEWVQVPVSGREQAQLFCAPATSCRRDSWGEEGLAPGA